MNNIMVAKVLLSVFVLGLAVQCFCAPSQSAPKTFSFDSFSKGFTISRVTDDNQQAQQPSNGYQVRFVPLISLLAGMFPTLLTKLGQFSGVNKLATTTTNNRSKLNLTLVTFLTRNELLSENLFSKFMFLKL